MNKVKPWWAQCFTFRAQKMHESSMHLCVVSCRKLRRKISRCQRTYKKNVQLDEINVYIVLWSLMLLAHDMRALWKAGKGWNKHQTPTHLLKCLRSSSHQICISLKKHLHRLQLTFHPFLSVSLRGARHLQKTSRVGNGDCASCIWRWPTLQQSPKYSFLGTP